MKLEVVSLREESAGKDKKFYAVVSTKYGNREVQIDKTRYNRAAPGKRITVQLREVNAGTVVE